MRLGMRTGRRWPTDASRSTTLCVRRSKLLGRSRRIAACRVVSRGPRTAGKRIRPCPPPSAYGCRLLLYFPDSLPHHPRLATTVTWAAPKQPRCRDVARVLLRGAPTSIRPWVGHRLRRLCSAEERKARGPRAQRASCSDSLRLSERSERSSRSEFRNGATRLSTTGDRRLQGEALHPKPQTVAHPRPTPALEHSSRRPAAKRREQTSGSSTLDREFASEHGMVAAFDGALAAEQLSVVLEQRVLARRWRGLRVVVA